MSSRDELRALSYGRAVPDFDFTSPMSPLLRLPSTVTSERKLVLLTACPDRDFVCAMSPELTVASPVVSPTSTPIVADTLSLWWPAESFTLVNVTVIYSLHVTPVRFTM